MTAARRTASAEQTAALTSDLIWLVEQDVTLPDGRIQRALVPQLYVRVREGDLSPTGSLIAANNIDLKLTGDLVNAGTIAGRQVVAINTDNIRNLGGQIQGRDIGLVA